MRMMLLACAIVGAIGCTKEPIFLYGRDYSQLQFDYSPDRKNIGVYPDTSVLDDPNNPFTFDPPSDTSKWDITSHLSAVPVFYCWATILAMRGAGDGEAQYYSALNLAQIQKSNLVADQYNEATRQLAIRAFDSVLLNFPNSVTYLANGSPLSLATLAAIQLDGMMVALPEGWVLVTDQNGNKQAVHQDKPTVQQ